MPKLMLILNPISNLISTAEFSSTLLFTSLFLFLFATFTKPFTRQLEGLRDLWVQLINSNPDPLVPFASLESLRLLIDYLLQLGCSSRRHHLAHHQLQFHWSLHSSSLVDALVAFHHWGWFLLIILYPGQPNYRCQVELQDLNHWILYELRRYYKLRHNKLS